MSTIFYKKSVCDTSAFALVYDFMNWFEADCCGDDDYRKQVFDEWLKEYISYINKNYELEAEKRKQLKEG